MMCCSGGWAPFAMIEAYSVWASVRPSRSKITVTRSPISLKIGERDDRISTVAISREIACTRRCSTEARMGSTAMLITAQGIRPQGVPAFKPDAASEARPCQQILRGGYG